MSHEFIAESLSDTEKVGQEIAGVLSFPCCVYLQGGMGAGKTTLTKSILAGLGYQGVVTSPTYNLIQEYEVEQGTVYHMDLYRVDDPEELEFLALQDLWGDNALFLVEWPEKGGGYLPRATCEISISTFRDEGVLKRKIILKFNN